MPAAATKSVSVKKRTVKTKGSKGSAPKGRSPKGTFTFRSVLENSSNKLWGAHFRIPEAAAKALIEGDNKRVICTLNGKERYQCAIQHYKTGLPVVLINRALRTKLSLEFGDAVDVQLEKDTSEYGLPMPEELKEIFRQDPEGKKVFHALTPGKQRTLLYIIGKSKDPDKRIGQALIIIHHIKKNNGKIEYRALNDEMKAARTPR